MEQDNQQEKRRVSRILLVLLSWLLFTLLVVALGYPKVRSALDESGVLLLLQDQQSGGGQASNLRTVQVAFADSPSSYQLFSTKGERLGGSAYHDTFEALLNGPSLEAIKLGAVSYIHPDTRRRGLTLSNRILYVDLSKEYLLSSDLKRAYSQIKMTALGFPRVKDVVVLVEGEKSN